MFTGNEQKEFSERLKAALAQNGYAADSPTKLAREFNSRTNDGVVTVHGARKWLQGESIPTQARIQVIASWLSVTAEWLRFGAGQPFPGSAAGQDRKILLNENEKSLLQGFHKLGARDQVLLLEMLALLQKLAENRRPAKGEG